MTHIIWDYETGDYLKSDPPFAFPLEFSTEAAAEMHIAENYTTDPEIRESRFLIEQTETR